ncbi:MAG: MarR family transcriptional regulator [Ornithinimicrobium sp.]
MSDDEPVWLSEVQQRVWRQWIAAQSELNAAIGRQLSQDSGMSLADFEVLVRLTEAPEGRVRIVELADTMQWERSRLSHHLTRMEKRELIVRRDCTADRRGAFAEVTRTGRQLIEQAAPGHAALVRSVFFDDASAEDLAAIERVTGSLLAKVSRL